MLSPRNAPDANFSLRQSLEGPKNGRGKCIAESTMPGPTGGRAQKKVRPEDNESAGPPKIHGIPKNSHRSSSATVNDPTPCWEGPRFYKPEKKRFRFRRLSAGRYLCAFRARRAADLWAQESPWAHGHFPLIVAGDIANFPPSEKSAGRGFIFPFTWLY